jgi:hypothetical protein
MGGIGGEVQADRIGHILEFFAAQIAIEPASSAVVGETQLTLDDGC